MNANFDKELNPMNQGLKMQIPAHRSPPETVQKNWSPR